MGGRVTPSNQIRLPPAPNPFHSSRRLARPSISGTNRSRSSISLNMASSTPDLSVYESDSNELQRLCVFCGSSFGVRPEYEAAATALGQQLVEEKIGLVYGGGTVGLMGVIAKTVLCCDDVCNNLPCTCACKAMKPPPVACRHLPLGETLSCMHAYRVLRMHIIDR